MNGVRLVSSPAAIRSLRARAAGNETKSHRCQRMETLF